MHDVFAQVAGDECTVSCADGWHGPDSKLLCKAGPLDNHAESGNMYSWDFMEFPRPTAFDR